jgi:hypothetical protein
LITTRATWTVGYARAGSRARFFPNSRSTRRGALRDEILAAADERSLRLLEAYLDRVHGASWRKPEDGERADDTGAGGGPMSEAEALSLLGLAPGATEDDIKAAHRRLMKQVHPDVGGSAYLAAKINEAKDLLLKA